ncbi:MAG: LemA family protein [Gammaproteobacteria bacterium]|nr:LemA family protein [Gammaproteobacteria bacterium]
MSAAAILTIIVLLVLAYAVLIYNKLITLRNRFKNSFSQIDVQLQRRYELIPNLVEIAKAYMDHENQTLLAVTEARNGAKQACDSAAEYPENSTLVDALAKAEGRLTNAMGKLSLVMEDYPELKADERMADLHEELTTTENRVGFARQSYSDSVMRYNTAREQFPAVIVANLCAFREANLFEMANEDMAKPINVSFA